ncbi:MAG: hypothetical protein RIS36_1927 [Pseudomonadota bacterium]
MQPDYRERFLELAFLADLFATAFLGVTFFAALTGLAAFLGATFETFDGAAFDEAVFTGAAFVAATTFGAFCIL